MKQRFIYVLLFFGMLFVSCSTDKNSKEFIDLLLHYKADILFKKIETAVG